MKVKNLDGTQYLKTADLENAFSVVLDRRGSYVYNLNETVFLDADPAALQEHVVAHD